MKNSHFLIYTLAAMLFTSCVSSHGFKLQQHLPSVQETKYGFYVKFVREKKSKSGPVRTAFIPALTDWKSEENRVIFGTQLWIVASDPYCKAEMEGARVVIDIVDRNSPSSKWLMELTPTSKGIFSVTKTKGVFFANPEDDAKLPNPGTWSLREGGTHQPIIFNSGM
jgi:hypothetical protein